MLRQDAEHAGQGCWARIVRACWAHAGRDLQDHVGGLGGMLQDHVGGMLGGMCKIILGRDDAHVGRDVAEMLQGHWKDAAEQAGQMLRHAGRDAAGMLGTC